MKLKILIEALLVSEAKGNVECEITGIEIDSRHVKPGNLFICLNGHTVNGHDYISVALEKGAAAILVQEPVNLASPVAVIAVPDTRRAMSMLANRFYGEPSRHLRVIGVTGTNGKTTTSMLIERMLSENGKKTGLIGTIHTKIGKDILPSENTTPECLRLHRLFHEMKTQEVTHVVMEVSSHALIQGRTRGVDFDTAIFTNLTQDHLDYHGTMEHYKGAKSLLFSQIGNSFAGNRKTALLNIDDAASRDYKTITHADVLTYGIKKDADILAKEIVISPSGTTFTIESPFGTESVSMKLIGLFNVYNALAAIGACLLEGFPLSTLCRSLEKIEGVSGRFESVETGQDFHVIVDYAHTPDSLENVLTTISSFTKGRIITVIGCGGERDKGKRPLMGAVAARHSYLSVFTSDNPRSEDPEAILRDMEKGLEQENIVTFPNREKAIAFALKEANAGDTVLIAGKGHETVQILKDRTIEFDDRMVAKKLLQLALQQQI